MAQADKGSSMKLIDIPNGTWESVCCDVEGHTSCEVSTPSGYLRIRAKIIDGNPSYEMQRFGADMMPLDADYPEYRAVSAGDLKNLLAGRE